MDGTGDLLFLRIGFDLIHSRHGRRKTKDEQSDFPFSTWLFHRRAPPEHRGCAAAVRSLRGAAARGSAPGGATAAPGPAAPAPAARCPPTAFVSVAGSLQLLLIVAAVPRAPCRRQPHPAMPAPSHGAAPSRGAGCCGEPVPRGWQR